MPDYSEPQSYLEITNMRSTGVTILGVMGGIWWLAGLAFAGALSLTTALPGLAAATLLVAVARRITNGPIDDAERRRTGKLIAYASAAEGVAIFVSNNVLLNFGLASYILCGMAVIVGLHFLPLARGLRLPVYYLTAAVLTALGLVACFMHDPSQRNLVVGLGSASTLWISGVWIAKNAKVAQLA
jgi:hypothetical protein